MMIFQDREHAGRLLAGKLAGRAGKDWLVLAIPRGGVVVGRVVADAIGADLDIIIPRKLGAPGDPELAIGAVTEDGTLFVDRATAAAVHATADYIREEAERQKREISRRMKAYRGDLPYPALQGRRTILVDDGVATGATMKAAIASVRKRGATTVIVAVPVAPPSTVSELERESDGVVCLQAPPYFQAVGQFYREFPQTTDGEVLRLLRKSSR